MGSNRSFTSADLVEMQIVHELYLLLPYWNKILDEFKQPVDHV